MKTEILKIAAVAFNVAALLAIFILAAWSHKNGYPEGRRYPAYIRFTISSLVFALLLQYAIYIDAKYIEPNWIKIDKITINNSRFPDSLSRLKIAHISDLHITRFGLRENMMIKKINRLKPDIIFITGDFINSKKDTLIAMSVLERLKSSKGIYAVFGNTDRHAFPGRHIDELKAALKNAGVIALENENRRVSIDAKSGLWIVGLSGKDIDTESRRKVFDGVNFKEPKVVLSHYPTSIDYGYLNSGNADLVLAGDTHGAQIGIPFLRAFSSQTEDLKYVSGLYNIKGVPLYVNRGIGMRHKNVRFLCRPEITIITLSNEKS